MFSFCICTFARYRWQACATFVSMFPELYSFLSTFLLRNSSSFIAESSSHCFPVRQRQRPKQRLWSACEPYSGRRAIKYYQLANSVAMSQLATCCNPSKNINAFFANHFVCCSWIHRVCVHLWRSLHHSSSFIIVHHHSPSFIIILLPISISLSSLSISVYLYMQLQELKYI
jgi:hypothetical protein